ncbi:MAG: hypothetical protein ACRDJW_07450 [Thermomicrobiales bacterium]
MLTRSPHADPDTVSSLTEALRAWRVAHPRATFAEIEVEAMRQVAALRSALIATALAADATASAPVCEACGEVMVRHGSRTRMIVTSQQERVPITGRRYRCPARGTEHFPPR